MLRDSSLAWLFPNQVACYTPLWGFCNTDPRALLLGVWKLVDVCIMVEQEKNTGNPSFKYLKNLRFRIQYF